MWWWPDGTRAFWREELRGLSWGGLGAGIPGGAEPKQKYLGGYLGFSLAFVALVAMRSTTNLMSALRASRRMHHSSLHSVVRAPVSFFDTTPIGRILNRFSKVSPRSLRRRRCCCLWTLPDVKSRSPKLGKMETGDANMETTDRRPRH